MATFDLDQELDLLEWDFTPKGQPRKSGAHGTIPEPSSAQLTAFTKAMRHLLAPVAQKVQQARGEAPSDISTLDPAAMSALLDEADGAEEEARETLNQIISAIAAVCSDSPSADLIKALPHRAQQAFFGYVVGTFLDPKAQTLGTS